MSDYADYERFVQGVMETLLRAQGFSDVEVRHDLKLPGISRAHQIDVYWEYRLAGVRHRVIVNCKQYKRAVSVDDIAALYGVLADYPGALGVVVTTTGFQVGAVEYARTHGIGLKVVRAAAPSDFDGRPPSVPVDVNLCHGVVKEIGTFYDKEWGLRNLSESEMAQIGEGRESLSLDAVVNDRRGNTRTSIRALVDQLPRNVPFGLTHFHTMRWPDALLEAPDRPTAMITRLVFCYSIEVEMRPIAIGGAVGDTLVRDAISNTLLFIDAGVVSGDVVAEFGLRRDI